MQTLSYKVRLRLKFIIDKVLESIIARLFEPIGPLAIGPLSDYPYI